MDKIKDKLTKLLRLAARNPNEHEAAAAYARAVDLAARHGLGLDDLDVTAEGAEAGPPPVEGIERRQIFAWRRACVWRTALARGIAEAHRCKIYTCSGNIHSSGLYAYGQPSDLDAVAYLFAAIAPEIERRGSAYIAASPGRGRAEARAFRTGMADEIARRLRESAAGQLEQARAEAYTRRGETGLARVDQIAAHVAEVTQAVDRYGREKLRLRKGSGFAGVGAAGYAAGRAAGQGMRLGSSKAIGG